MALFAIGDLHLALGSNKPMDIFPGWERYLEKIETSWRQKVGAEDTVVVVGDVSWAMKLEDCRQDFELLESLPGHKILMKGNHDYWWGTVSKMERFLEENKFTSLSLLHNNSFFAEGVSLCGTRSWLFDADEPQDDKIMKREVGRLRMSLDAAEKQHPGGEKLVFLHYPPLHSASRAEEVLDVLKEYKIQRCFYGHLHGPAIRWAVQGMFEGIEYKLVSADALGFSPYEIQFTK